MSFPVEILAFLALVGFFAGLIDSMAGGGGLLTLPALLATGMNPLMALGTNKLQSTLGTGGAALAYARGGHMHIGRYWPTVAAAFLGSLLGAWLVQRVSPAFLAAIIPVLLIAMAGYFLFSHRLGEEDRHHRVGIVGLSVLIGAVGCYDGFFGPGAGAFYTTVFLSMGGLGLLRATAQTKAANFASNLSALAVLMVAGHIVWVAGLVMAASNIIGAQIGSRMAMRFGARLIRPLLVVMSLALTAKMLIDAENPVHIMLFGG